MTRIEKFAIDMLLFSTCGEDEDTLANADVKEIGPSTFHITYKAEDPYDGMDFKVKVEREMNETGCTSHFNYSIYDSVYGDDGEFTLQAQ